MQYGEFDNKNKEYIIKKPNTPKSWSNYLGSTEYGSIITNNGGGYSFYKSAAQGRFMRLRFNSIPMDQPGRYIYIRDQEKGDFWSGTWQPVGKSLDEYRSICRHGTGYTIIESEYDDILTETKYFVPLDENFECWNMKIKNNGNRPRKLRLFTFVEYTCHWLVWNDFINLQYNQYIVKMDMVDNIIDHGINVFLPYDPDDFESDDIGRHTFLTVVGAEPSGFDTDRDTFIGPYNDYSNPRVLQQGECENSIAVGGNGCGTLQIDVELEPGESKDLSVLMGIGRAGQEGKEIRKKYGEDDKIEKEFQKLKQHWHDRISGLTVQVPDNDLDDMMEVWNPYNCHITYAWSRSASLVYSGARDGLGYRDTIQDMLGVLHNIPEEAGKRLRLMLTGQVSSGGAMPVVKPFDHHPGNESQPEEDEYRSDDCLWLFNTVPEYVKETGNISFFKEVLPYADKGEDTVFKHLKKALVFNLNRTGKHGLPCGLSADWNDCLNLGQEGESLFVAFQLRYSLKEYIDIAGLLGKDEEIYWAKEKLEELDKNIDEYGWDGDWYLRAYREDGMKFGSSESEEGNIFVNPQTWAVLSGHADKEKAKSALQAVRERLSTKYGIMICEPFEKTDPEVINAPLFNKGMKENGSIFCHTQGWAIIAETILGNGNKAFEYLKSYLPSRFNDKAEVREIEPYVYCQNTHSKYSPRFGTSRIPWLSGTAAWSYYSTMKYILGLKPEYDGISIDPCIPSDWDEFTMKRIFRNKKLNIKVENKGVEKGVEKLLLNGTEIQGCFIPENKLNSENDIKVIMDN